MKRLEFVRKVALGAGYVAVAGCIGACSHKTAKTEQPAKASAGPKAEPVLGFSIDLNEPKYAVLDKPGEYAYYKKVIIVRTNKGELVAFDKKCPHQGGRLYYQKETNLFKCRRHGSLFSSEGALRKGPAKKNMTAHNLAKKDGALTITPKG
ncbi:MAG: Rieske (2Fe-2S) protein [Flavobacteriales bacterium]|nr:Rieske (2Fe-2S) protein [Flavobacteriales bacterium]